MPNSEPSLISRIRSAEASNISELDDNDLKTTSAEIASNGKDAKSTAEEMMSLIGVPATTSKTFLTLPTELQIKVFIFLDPVDATCLALTSRLFYAIYRNSSKAIGLEVPVSLFQKRKSLKWGASEAWSSGNLLGALREWIGSDLVFNVHISKVVTRRRDKEIFDQTFPNGWHSIELRETVEGQAAEESDEEQQVWP